MRTVAGHATARRASDVLVECLEAEHVRRVFGIPGEETLDLNESLSRSSIAFVPVRHEQAGAFMADVQGRLTGRAGVCMATLGPGATNLVTAVADAFLDRAPLVALTGQASLQRIHKESHQYVDVLSLLRPVTKWNARASDPATIPELVRKAFKVAEGEKPGPTHLELPEDVLAAPLDARPLPRHAAPRPEPAPEAFTRAAELIGGAGRPVLLAGNGVVRGRAADALRAFARLSGIPVAETFMGKGLMPPDDPLALGPVGIQAGDYRMAGFEEADLVVTVGYDLVEHAPSYWNPDRQKRIVCLDTVPAEIDEHFVPEVELVGDLRLSLLRLAKECNQGRRPVASGLRDAVLAWFEQARADDHFPMRPPRVLYEIRRVLGPGDILVSDVGLHKLWIGRVFPTREPNTVLIANGLAGMGFAIPAAIAAKLVHPERQVLAVAGDGGFLMNCQELETAVRLGTAFVVVVWEDGHFGSIEWKQRRRFGRSFGTAFGNPDLVGLAAAFGMPAWRCGSADQLPELLLRALRTGVPSLVSVPIDYSQDVAIVEQLGEEIVRA
jgi:acetolactate synthase-1/2/3 large subunit